MIKQVEQEVENKYLRDENIITMRLAKFGYCRSKREIEFCFDRNYGRFLIHNKTLKRMNSKQKLRLLKMYNKPKPKLFIKNFWHNFIKYNFLFFKDLFYTNYRILRRFIK